jgi:hypothetical protein
MNDKEQLALNYLAFCDHTLQAWLTAESPEAKEFAIDRLTHGACAVIGVMCNMSGLPARVIDPNGVYELIRELSPDCILPSDKVH